MNVVWGVISENPYLGQDDNADLQNVNSGFIYHPTSEWLIAQNI